MPRFSETSCSQCGKDLGPGDCGVSSCADHTMKHTPGPWLAPCGYGVSRFEVQGDGHRVAVVDRVQDARAISAVPDMLAALQVLLRDYAAVHDIGDVEMQPAIYQARAAIAKAIGSAT